MSQIWIAAGLRTPFTKVDGALKERDAISMSVPIAQAMSAQLADDKKPDLFIWGGVAPNLTYSNIAREIWLDAGLDPTIPSFSTVMACSTSMAAALEAAGQLGRGGKELALVGGVESMSRVRLSEMKWEKAGMEEYGGGHEMAEGAPGSAGEQQRGVERS